MPVQTPNPLSSTFTPVTLVTWANGSLFTGALRLGLIVPLYGGTTNAGFLTLAAFSPPVQVPLNTFLPITNGVSTSGATVIYNSSLLPPNSQYVAWWYDSTGVLIAGPSVQFTISTPTFTPPAAVLTTPSVGSTLPGSAA